LEGGDAGYRLAISGTCNCSLMTASRRDSYSVAANFSTFFPARDMAILAISVRSALSAYGKQNKKKSFLKELRSIASRRWPA
jgi:hypothetical protein